MTFVAEEIESQPALWGEAAALATRCADLLPARGERADPSRHPERVANFRGNEMRDGRGHVSKGEEHGHDDGHDNRH